MIVTNYYVEKIFPVMELDRFQRKNAIWDDRKLRVNDWQGLTKKLIEETFGYSVLEPLEETETTFKLEVKHTDLREFISMIEHSTRRCGSLSSNEYSQTALTTLLPLLRE